MNKRIQADFQNASFSTNQFVNCECGDIEVSFQQGFSNQTFYNSLKFPTLTQTQIALQISKILKSLINKVKEIPSKKSLFDAKKIPKIDIPQYLQRIVKYSRVSSETLLIALIYVKRFCNSCLDYWLNFSNVHKLFKKINICLCSYCQLSNKDFSKIGGINAQELMILEMEFLKILKFQLRVSCVEFQEEIRKSFN